MWAALAGAGLVLLAWGIARHATRRLDVAWLTGAIVATSFGYFSMARSALPDLPLTYCITLGIWATLRAVDAAGTRSGDSGAPALALKWWLLAGVGLVPASDERTGGALCTAVVLLPNRLQARRLSRPPRDYSGGGDRGRRRSSMVWRDVP